MIGRERKLELLQCRCRKPFRHIVQIIILEAIIYQLIGHSWYPTIDNWIIDGVLRLKRVLAVNMIERNTVEDTLIDRSSFFSTAKAPTYPMSLSLEAHVPLRGFKC